LLTSSSTGFQSYRNSWTTLSLKVEVILDEHG
jgi:hypothetical protein